MANRYWLVANCSLTGDMTTNNLTWNPHPTEFTPYSEVKTQGDGALRGLGYAQFKWASDDGILIAQQWAHLMSFFTGDEPSVSVCVRTRTDRCTLVGGVYEYEYKWFAAEMHRPTGTPYPPFRFKDVEILFTHAVEVR